MGGETGTEASIKPYALHEFVYRKMRARGIGSWVERTGPAPIDADCERFLADVLAEPWVPKTGEVLEIGCGTAPILRWFVERGYKGTGIDVSRTALRMARAASKGYRIRFVQDDVCSDDLAGLGGFDICVDGLCLHCITDEGDRARLLKRVAGLLRPGGIFVVMTMCRPVDKSRWTEAFPGQRLVGDRIYVPMANAMRYAGSLRLDGQPHLATRYLAHWTSILADLRSAGFRERLIRFHRCSAAEPMSSLDVAASIKGEEG